MSSQFIPDGVIREIPNGLEMVHDDVTSIDLFAERGQISKIPLYTKTPTSGGFTHKPFDGFFALRNTVSGEVLDSPPVAKTYKLVDHGEVFRHQGNTIVDNASLPTGNLTVVDRLYEGGRKASRAVYFNDLTFDIDGKGDGVTARADIVNSVDMSWAFQVFSGAYRDYCRNTMVFGGQKAYHQKRKHTASLSPSAMIAKANLGLDMFMNHREKMDEWMTIELHPSQWTEILENTVCRLTGEGRKLSSDNTTRVNGRLLDYLTYRFNEEQRELGRTLWAGYNALTHWATHTDTTWERQNDDGTTTELQTSRGNAQQHRVQFKRNADVRAVLESPQWLALEAA